MRWFTAFLSIVAVLAGIEIYALVAHNRERAASAPTVAGPTKTAAPGPEGSVDTPNLDEIAEPVVSVSGWALDPAGVRSVEIRIAGHAYQARMGIARPDVAKAKPGVPNNANSGFEWQGDLVALPAPPGADRRRLTIVAIANDGREHVLGTRSYLDPDAARRWSAFVRKDAAPFYLLPALSGLDLGGASELDTYYARYLSSSVRIGFRVPILYLRMTKGASADYVFDPDWDPRRKCGERRIGDDSLNAVVAHAKEKKLPVLVTLNGGIWADAYCDVPQWDVNDKLEQDARNCQWNEKNEVMPDDFLKGAR